MNLILPKCKQPSEDLTLDKVSSRIISGKIRKGAERAASSTTMLHPDKSIFEHSYTDVDTSKRLSNANFGEEYQHLDATSEHVGTYFKLQREAQRAAPVACQCSALP